MKKSRLMTLRFFGFIFGLISLAIGFQNCTEILFQQSNLSKAAESGVPYGGMQKAEYDRFIPDFSCIDNGNVSKPAPIGMLEIFSNSVNLTENKSLRCGAVNLQLDPQIIDHSIYQNEVIGYLEGIFEGQSSTPQSIPANLVEVWCRDRNDDQGIETITHYDRVKHQAVNRIYSAVKGQAPLITNFSVARTLGATSVNVKSKEYGFDLTVYRDQPALQPGLFKGTLQALINGQEFTRDTSCRLGGTVDPQVWPSLQIVDLNVRNWITSPNQKYFSYVTDQGKSVYTAKADGTEQRLVNTSMYDVLNFHFSADSQSLVLVADETMTAAYSLLKVNIDGSGKSILGQTHETLRSVTSDFKFSADGASVFFRAGVPSDGITSSWQPLAKWLESVPLSGGIPKILNPPFSDSMVGVSNFDVGPQKVAFLCCDEGYATLRPGGEPDLYSRNLDGSDLRKITPKSSVAGAHSPFHSGDPLSVDPSGRYVLIGEYAVALDGSATIQFPNGLMSVLSSPSAEFSLLRASFGSTASPELFSMKSVAPIRLPTLKYTASSDPGTTEWRSDQTLSSTFFNRDSSALIARQLMNDGQLQAISIGLPSGSIRELCPGLISPVMEIKEFSLSSYLILTLDQQSGILSIYQTSNGKSCIKLNSVAVTSSAWNDIASITLSPDHQKILVRLAATKMNPNWKYSGPLEIASQLFYIPLDGTPALQISTPVTPSATITQAVFLEDSTTVVFVGNQIRLSEIGVFKWSALKP